MMPTVISRELVAGHVGAVQIAAPDALAQALVPDADQPGLGEDRADRELRDAPTRCGPGALTTATPRARAAAMSMLVGPPRETAMSFRSGQRSSSQPVTGAR